MKKGARPAENLPHDILPHEVAERCRHLCGLVFLDSALRTGEEQLSIVAAEPSEVLRGNIFTDAGLLQREIRSCEGPGAAIGWISYEGDLAFGIYHDILLYDHVTRQWHEHGTLSSRLSEAPAAVECRLSFHPSLQEQQFCCMVERALEYIAAGDIYQVNLSHHFTAGAEGDPWDFYRRLRSCSPAPYAAYLDLGGKQILSSSPEMFLKMSGRRISTRPIKGTRPRHPEPREDARLARELLSSTKETAELVMITDLERNDLGQVCRYGSVEVQDLLALERYEQVFHLVSTVRGTLRDDVDHVEALLRCFPGGSITGAPKKRAREIIRELEPQPRGVYTGAVGYFGFDGESQFNVAIRTVEWNGARASFGVGAGIVADSIPQMEYAETLHKAAGILLAARPGAGCFSGSPAAGRR